MNHLPRKPKIAVISPFLDKRHGTERIALEWLSRLPPEFELHVYSQHVEDWDPVQFVFHPVPALRGPHLLSFVWWLLANHFQRARDRRRHGLQYDLVYSPGINCLDADVISVHIVFAEFRRQIDSELRFLNSSIRSWPRLLHRRLYYRLLVALERRLYHLPQLQLVLYAKKTARDLQRWFGRSGPMPVLYLGLDHDLFNPARRASLRDPSRRQLGLATGQFVLLLIGNDLRKKGISVLFEALTLLPELPLTLLIAGKEPSEPFQAMARAKSLEARVRFLPQRPDVEFYYAAADVYVGPSLEDTFALPPQEAMACGLPVIVSAENGTSEIIHHETDGLILNDPKDAKTLAGMISRLYRDRDFRDHLAINAAQTAAQFTWDRNARELAEVFRNNLARKGTARR